MAIEVLTPKRPYLLRADYEWLLDNQLTPYISVDVLSPNVIVPTEYVKDGQIVLNISPRATKNLLIDNHAITFQAKFGEKVHSLYIPMPAIIAIFAQETGDGTMFAADDIENYDYESKPAVTTATKKPIFKKVK